MRASRTLADDVVGRRFGTWIVLSVAPRTRTGARQFRAACEVCANEHVTQLVNLQRSECARCRTERSAMNDLFASYAWNARRRGHVFELDRNTFAKLVTSPCHYCGDPPTERSYYAKAHTLVHGVDRQNNALGYTLANSVACCAFCNLSKHDRPVEEFRAWLDRFAERRR